MAQLETIIVSLVFLSTIITLRDGKTEANSNIQKDAAKNAILPPCKLCSVLVESFKKGLKRTEKSNFQGGDTAWEEEKLGNYASSEVRLVEIQEKLCDDVERGNYHCHTLANEYDWTIDKWWSEHKANNVDLFQWLCIEQLKFCCPVHHYGPLCKPCPGHPNQICNGNGKCRGAGTRKGNGTCDCDAGYEGDLCSSCKRTYYESYRDEFKLLCSKCHAACRDICTEAGTRGCVACNPGWFHDAERGCVDVNECVSKSVACSANEFCINNEGSYTCLGCDKACNGCQGDGPDMCDACAEGYMLQDGLCIADEAQWSKGWHIRRYLTYLGLCIATCIIFQNNPAVASFIGLCVAIYVTVSEYMLGIGSSSLPFTNL